jgi:hypothetical protein
MNRRRVARLALPGLFLTALLAAAAPAADAAALLRLDGPVMTQLRDARVRVSAVAPARLSEDTIRLPARALTVDAGTRYVPLDGSLRLDTGRRSVTVRGLELQLTGFPSLSVRVGQRRLALLTLDRHSGAWTLGGAAASVDGAAVRLTSAGAALLRRRLGRDAIRPGRLGRVSVQAAQAAPATPAAAIPADAPPGARAVTGGTVRWSPRASWLGYLRQGEGARAEGAAAFDGTAYSLPIAGGWYDPATQTASIHTTGVTAFRFSGHGIDIALGDWAYALGATTSTAAATVLRAGHLTDAGRGDLLGTRIVIAEIAPGASPAADGGSVTWSDRSLALAPSGASVFDAYPPGSEQGRVSISATLG